MFNFYFKLYLLLKMLFETWGFLKKDYATYCSNNKCYWGYNNSYYKRGYI